MTNNNAFVGDHCHEAGGLELRSLDSERKTGLLISFLSDIVDLNEISCKIGVMDVFNSLPGLLSHNHWERRDFNRYLDDHPNFEIEEVLFEIFDLRLPEVETRWQREDRICLNCWREILTLGAREWWFAKKKTRQSQTRFDFK